MSLVTPSEKDIQDFINRSGADPEKKGEKTMKGSLGAIVSQAVKELPHDTLKKIINLALKELPKEDKEHLAYALGVCAGQISKPVAADDFPAKDGESEKTMAQDAKFEGDLAGLNDIQGDPFTELEKKIALRAEVAALKFQSELEKGEIPDENLAGLKDIRF